MYIFSDSEKKVCFIVLIIILGVKWFKFGIRYILSLFRVFFWVKMYIVSKLNKINSSGIKWVDYFLILLVILLCIINMVNIMNDIIRMRFCLVLNEVSYWFVLLVLISVKLLLNRELIS